MALQPPFPSLDEMITLVGLAGQRMEEIGATEGAAGNISVFMGWPVDPGKRFPQEETIPLPQALPAGLKVMIDGAFLVTGSGRRLREIHDDPEGNLGVLLPNPDGCTGRLYTSPRRGFARLTSEFNSHLAVHADQAALTGTNFLALVHAQPRHLVYLSHLPEYQDEEYLNRHIYRWQPETIMTMPEGIGLVPFAPPGSAALQAANVAQMRGHRLVIWARHGVLARSVTSIKRACDTIEYAEAGAHYEYLNLVNGERSEGLSAEDIRAIAASCGVQQTIF